MFTRRARCLVRRRWSGTLIAALGVAVLALGLVMPQAQTALATTKTWGDGSSNWSTASFWIPTGLPAFGDAVNITLRSGSTVTYDIGIAQSNLSSLTISGGNGVQANTLSMPANNIIN